MAGPDALCDFFNQGWLSFTGRTLEQEYGTGWAEGVHPEDFARCMQTYMDAFVERRPFTMEYRLRRRDGVYRWIFDQGAPRFAVDGAFAGFIGSCVDVTEQREAREALSRLNQILEERVRERTALASERAMLIREVHHRVKNDLQLISSLLSIQGREFGESQPARAFEECQARVQAIAQVHEQMYQSDDLATMSFSDHLRTLTGYLARAEGRTSRIELELDVGDRVVLRVDRAIPCAMIVHELVVNSFKHAFPGERSGRVRVACRREPDGGLQVVVEDDGIGMSEPAGGAPRAGLGWTLIETFARQLKASLRVERGAGTRVELRFVDSREPAAPRPSLANGSHSGARAENETELRAESGA
jgi:PAS domain S-box-containing protein